MSNTHGIADFASELQASFEDMLPACVISTTWPTVPASSLTLAAFATQAYARDLQQLVYVDQPAVTVTLGSAAGAWWVAVSRDTFTAYSGWTRRAGSHYLFQASVSRPADVDGLLVAIQVTVAGAVITAVTPAPGVTRAEAWRTLAGLGTMAQQNASAVAITGGTALDLAIVRAAVLTVLNQAGNDQYALYTTMNGGGGSNRWALHCAGDANSYLNGAVFCHTPTSLAGRLSLLYERGTEHGIVIKPVNDSGGTATISFTNAASTQVGTIQTTAAATSYNTSSDARLKHAITDLSDTAALAVLAALRPVTFLWNATGEEGVGFLAQDVQAVVDGVITGEADALNEDGSIRPQQIDHSRLVPWLVSGVQALLRQVDALRERCEALEARLAAADL